MLIYIEPASNGLIEVVLGKREGNLGISVLSALVVLEG
jgi:hypothetical protein